ncbi:high-affinity branched-chain amino acid ABC transporter permease LivM [Rhodoligotrophos ferricapiens]|uniref:high-affinity branched-chain amino acid ABC transporter permease LivM n=1 Tax=Rhodoligotrophos ferricapiens TaxID=3069264 RepID=UPI00315CC2BC
MTAVSAPEHVGVRPRSLTADLVKEGALAALVVAALTIGLVGFRTIDTPAGLSVTTRFLDVLAAAVIAFIGRIWVAMLEQDRPRPVALMALPVTAILLLMLLSYTLFGENIGRILHASLPFEDPVVMWIVAATALVIGLRAVWMLRHGGRTLSQEEAEARKERVAARVKQISIYVGPVLLLLALAFPFIPGIDRRLLDIGILVVTYIMLGWGLNIVVGLAGLLDLGYVAFYAVGAYSYALLGTYYDASFWLCLPFAGIMAAFAGILLGFPVLRLRGDYLAIVTLGFGEMIRVVLINWYEFTGGPNGISGIPRPSFFGLPFERVARDGQETFHSFFGLTYSPQDRIIFLYYLILALALVTNLFTLRIRRMPIGRAWEALREDEIACKSLGISPRNTKLTAFAIGAMFAGFAGAFFATRQGFVSPESFTFIESAVILAIVVLGGFGSQLGIVFATLLLIGLPEFFRELQEYRMLAFGGAMVLIMLWRPAGLLAHRSPTMLLSSKA